MPANNSASCTVVNHNEKDILLFSDLSEDEKSGSQAKPGYNSSFEILQTGQGGSSIPAGATGTITLDRQLIHPADASSTDVPFYNLQVVESTWLYPLATLSVERQDGGNGAAYPQQTVAAGVSPGISQTAKFLQTYAAYPASQLARDYRALLDSLKPAVLVPEGSTGTGSDIARDMAARVAAFFAATESYKDVTLTDLVAVQRYYDRFPFVWTAFKKSVTYYIYAADDTSATFEGALQLSLTAKADPTQANGGLTCRFVPAVTPSDTTTTAVDTARAIPMTYSDGIFVNDVANPAIALKGNFMVKNVFTEEAGDKDILQVMAGNVNGRLCIGFDAPQAAQAGAAPVKAMATAVQASSPAAVYWDTLVHPKNQHDLMISILTLMGATMLVPGIVLVVYSVYKLVQFNREMRAADLMKIVEYRYDARSAAARDVVNVRFENVCGKNNNIIIEHNFNNPEGVAEALLNDSYAIRLDKAFTMQHDALKEMAHYKNKMDADEVSELNSALGDIAQAVKILDSTPRTRLGDVLQEQMSLHERISQTIGNLSDTVTSYLSSESKAAIQKSTKISVDIFTDVKTEMENQADMEKSANPEVEEPVEFREALV